MSVLIVAAPSKAYASDGFLGGLQDLVGAREVESAQEYESEYLVEYEPQLREDPPDPGTNELTEIEEGQEIQSVVNAANTVSFFGTDNSLFEALRRFLGVGATFRTLYVLPAVGLVFMWWGVRKSIKMLMSAFRKGSMNV